LYDWLGRVLTQSFTLAKQALMPEPHLQSILLWYFEDGHLLNYLPGLVSNHDISPSQPLK
jgi:hypothetical protein